MKFLRLRKAEVVQPNKPKPTTILPDNMEWSWDPNAADWVAVMKNNTNVTPPLYNPQNQNVVNQNTTSYMSNIKSASSKIADKNGKKAEEGMWLYKPMVHSTFRGGIPVRLFQVKIRHQKDGTDKPYLLSENKLITKGISHIKDGILFDTYEEAKQYSESHKTKEEKEFDKLDDWQKTDYYLSKQSSCLSEFLDGPRYSKEIKIEAGLIKDGLVKYAGFDFNKGTKYAITTKGLEVLRKAFEKEHNEALNEREKLAYMFGFNTDEVSTLDTTGKVIKSEEITDEQLEESWNKYYPLYRQDIEAEKMTEENYPTDDEVAQKLKTTLSMYLQGLKRYRKAIPIMKYHTNAKMKRAIEDGHSKGLSEDEITKQVDAIAEEYYKKENKIKPTFNSLSEDYLKSFLFGIIKNKKSASLNKFAKKWTICEADGSELGEVEAKDELDAKVKFGIEHPEYADSQSICAKEIKAGLEYNGAFEYNDYKIDLFNDTDGGATFVIYAPQGKTVNHESMYKGTASTMDEAITKAYNIIDGSKEIDAKYEEITESHEPYPNPSETPNDHIILENHDGWVNTASFEDDIRKQFMKPHQPIENSDRDLNLLEEQILQLVNDDKKDEVHKLFDQLQFSDKEASVNPKFAKLQKHIIKF